MVKLSVAMILGVVLCATSKAEAPGSEADQKLLSVMGHVAELVREAVPLAKQEFAVLKQKYGGDQYNNLIVRTSTPIHTAAGLGDTEHMRIFRERLAAEDKHFVGETILVTLDQLRGLDGVILAEAVAGSPKQDQLLDLYQREEAALSNLTLAYQAWRSHIHPNLE
jgi:hypothetical protein